GLEVDAVEAGAAARVEHAEAQVLDRHAVHDDAVDVEPGEESRVDAEAPGGHEVGGDAPGNTVGRRLHGHLVLHRCHVVECGPCAHGEVVVGVRGGGHPRGGDHVRAGHDGEWRVGDRHAATVHV